MAYEIVVPYPIHQENVGGVDRVIQAIAKNSSSEFNFTILTPEASETKREFYSEINILEFKKRIPGWTMDYRRPYVHRKMNEFDLIWCNELMIADIVASKETPSLMTYHGLEHRHYPGFPTSWSQLKNKVQSKLMERGFRFIQYMDRVVCVSKYARNQVDRNLRAKPAVIYNPSDGLGREFSEDDDGFILMMDGTQKKNLADRIEEKYNYPVKMIREVVQEYRDDSVSEMKPISDQEIAEAYKKCSFYLNNSFNDTFGLTPIEANNFGKFALVRDKEPHEENIENWVNGYKALNSRDLIEAIGKLIEDEEERREVSRKAFEYVQNRFTTESAVNDYEEEFRLILKQG